MTVGKMKLPKWRHGLKRFLAVLPFVLCVDGMLTAATAAGQEETNLVYDEDTVNN